MQQRKRYSRESIFKLTGTGYIITCNSINLNVLDHISISTELADAKQWELMEFRSKWRAFREMILVFFWKTMNDLHSAYCVSISTIKAHGEKISREINKNVNKMYGAATKQEKKTTLSKGNKYSHRFTSSKSRVFIEWYRREWERRRRRENQKRNVRIFSAFNSIVVRSC